MTKVLTYEDGIAAVYGGAILGGGGGGLLEEGLKLVKEIFAAGEPQIIDITELDDEDSVCGNGRRTFSSRTIYFERTALLELSPDECTYQSPSKRHHHK